MTTLKFVTLKCSLGKHHCIGMHDGLWVLEVVGNSLAVFAPSMHVNSSFFEMGFIILVLERACFNGAIIFSIFDHDLNWLRRLVCR